MGALVTAPTSADTRASLEAVAGRTYAVRTDLRALNGARAPGFYVSAVDGGRRMLVEGPFEIHAGALVALASVRDAWCDADDRAWFYGWGTARVIE